MKAKYVYRNGRWIRVEENGTRRSKRHPNPEGEFIHVYEPDRYGNPRLVDVQWYQID